MSKMMEKSSAATVASLIGAMASVFMGGALAAPAGWFHGRRESAMLKYGRDFEAQADSTGFSMDDQGGV